MLPLYVVNFAGLCKSRFIRCGHCLVYARATNDWVAAGDNTVFLVTVVSYALVPDF